MRTAIEIDDRIMAQAMRRSGIRSEKTTIAAGLHSLVGVHLQTAIRRRRGKGPMGRDLSESRLDHPPNWRPINP
jgi:Arc/MetJ family transcription regulator